MLGGSISRHSRYWCLGTLVQFGSDGDGDLVDNLVMSAACTKIGIEDE
jgi:hypothetical protein